MCDGPGTLNRNMISVKKRNDQWENEVPSENTSPSDENVTTYGDRFIPRRFMLAQCESNLKFAVHRPARDVMRWCLREGYWRENTYVPTVNRVMEMREKRIYILADPAMQQSTFAAQRRNTLGNTGLDWPCHPRTKPFAYTDKTFDLPDYEPIFEQNLVDWSSKGQIVFSFGHDVVIWQNNVDITMSFSVKCPRSLAYSPSGEFLAIGCQSVGFPVVELWSVCDDFTAINGKIFQYKHREILCIEWTISSEHLVCGTRYGTIYVLSVPELKTVRKMRMHQLPVTILRLSPKSRFLASGDSEGNIVIYHWSTCIVYLHVKSRRKLNVVFDWHPWTGVDLAISEDIPPSIVLLHVPSKKIVGYYQQDGTNMAINSISFSKLTGELLVSISSQDGGICDNYKVLVMSSLDRIVDILKMADGGARFLTWSPDGTQVATTGNDETLTMWKFCPERRKRIIKRVKDPKEPLFSEAKFGIQFKLWHNLK